MQWFNWLTQSTTPKSSQTCSKSPLGQATGLPAAFWQIGMVGMLSLGSIWACNLPIGKPPTVTPLPPTVLPSATYTPPPASPLPNTLAPATPTPTLPNPTGPTVTTPSNTTAQIQVAYQKDHALWLWRATDGATSLGEVDNVSQILFSPDGRWLAVRQYLDTNYQKMQVRVFDLTTGSNAVVLSDTWLATLPLQSDSVSTGVSQLGWIPNSTKLAFSTYPIYYGMGAGDNEDLYWVDVATTNAEPQRVLPAGSGGDFSFSPDGRQMVISSSGDYQNKPAEISLLDISGDNRRSVLTHPSVLTYSEYAYRARPFWLPDSRSLLVAIPPAEGLIESPLPHVIWQIDATSGIATEQAQLSVGSIIPPFAVTFAPDGQHMAYIQEQEQLYTLHLATIDGRTDQAISDLRSGQSPNMLGWMSDSHSFLFSVPDNTTYEQLYYLAELNGHLRPLFLGQHISHLEWLTGEQFLAVVETGNNTQELRISSLDGSATIITTEPYVVYAWTIAPR